MKLRDESIKFYKKILENKINDNQSSITISLFKGSSNAFYKKLNTLKMYGYISIESRNKGLITLNILNDAGIKVNQRNKKQKKIVHLTKNQLKILQCLRRLVDTTNLNLTSFASENNLCDRNIYQNLQSMRERHAIFLKKNKPGFYNITINDIKTFNELNNEETLGTVYFIQNIISKSIKIGFTTKEISCRIKQLQTGNENKLKILFHTTGSYKIEKEIHKKFESLRLEGEWFKESQEIYDYLKQIK